MKTSQQECGITLVEIIVALALFSVVIAGAFRLFKTSNENALDVTATLKIQDQLKTITSTMKKGIQSAGYQLSNPREHFVAHQDSITVSFVDAFGYYRCSGNSVVTSYYLRDTVLIQFSDCNGVSVEIPLAQNIDSLGFTYLNRYGNSTSALDSIAEIEFTIRLKSRAVKKDQLKLRSSTSRITLQNF